MTGKRSAFRDVGFPDNFDDWPDNAKVQYLRKAVKKRDIQDYIADVVDMQDQTIKQSFTKDQLAEVCLWIANHEDDRL